MMRKTVRFIWAGLGGLACAIATAWATGALSFDLPIALLRSPLAFTTGGPTATAPPIVSLQSPDPCPACFSIEPRKQPGKTSPPTRGLYRQFELIYVAADERDVIPRGPNSRRGEEIYLYRTTAT